LNLQLSASVKLAPFATRTRHGYVPNSIEKDLSLHLENALKGVILPDQWPKSALEVNVTVLEGEDDRDGSTAFAGIALYNLLAAAINVSVAALSDARIDCLDVLSAGVGAVVSGTGDKQSRILDLAANEHDEILSACVVGYLPSRDEIVELWSTNTVSGEGKGHNVSHDDLIDSAIAAAKGAQFVLNEVLLESLTKHAPTARKALTQTTSEDIEMKT
jgi:exosome complex component MTR3